MTDKANKIAALVEAANAGAASTQADTILEELEAHYTLCPPELRARVYSALATRLLVAAGRASTPGKATLLVSEEDNLDARR